MREFIHNIDREDYHRIVYKGVVDGDHVLQPNLEGDILVLPNPERYPRVPHDEPITTKPEPLKGQMPLPRAYPDIKELMYGKLNGTPNGRGATPRGRRP